MHVLAHEWGRHISNLSGAMDGLDRSSVATSGSVRLELQADCYAGTWVKAASTAVDPDTGVPFLKPVAKNEISDALNAAAAVGDDNIVKRSGGYVNPDAFTHGSSEQRKLRTAEAPNSGNASSLRDTRGRLGMRHLQRPSKGL